jgi:hypothetical protein
MSGTALTKPAFDTVVAGGFAAGVAAALLNDVYAAAFRATTGFDFPHPTYGNITAASIVPCALAALGYFALTRFTPRAGSLLALVTTLVTVASFGGVFQSTLPDGRPKPPGFDALVMPMHAVVGILAAFMIPRFAPEVARLRAWLAACKPPTARRET